jgi:hypothetical protein
MTTDTGRLKQRLNVLFVGEALFCGRGWQFAQVNLDRRSRAGHRHGERQASRRLFPIFHAEDANFGFMFFCRAPLLCLRRYRPLFARTGAIGRTLP